MNLLNETAREESQMEPVRPVAADGRRRMGLFSSRNPPPHVGGYDYSLVRV